MELELPEGVSARIENKQLILKGPQGEVKIAIARKVNVELQNRKIVVNSANKALQNTTEALVINMITGVNQGYKKTLKLIHAHFPITLLVSGKEITVKDFLGEKMPRKTKVFGNTKVESKGPNVTISGPDKHAVGQTLANIRTAMKIKDKDGRVFQDGIYEVADE